MERSAYRQLAAIDQEHWWFVYRRKLIAQMIDKVGGIHADAVLDIGCGTGGNLAFLKRLCANVSGLDLMEDAISLARMRFPDADFRLGDVNNLRDLYAAGSFDLISDFNVLYHEWVKSDLKVMRDVYHLLRPGGLFILTEPAFSFLRRAHDIVGHGARRYTLRQLTAMLGKTGLRVERGTYFNLPALPPALLLALIDRSRPPPNMEEGVRELQPPPKWINNVVSALLAAELGTIKIFGSIPIGVGIACVARKPRA